MNDKDANDRKPNEPAFIKLSMDLTGASESAARGVFMHVCCDENEARNGHGSIGGANGTRVWDTHSADRRASTMNKI